MAPLLTLERFGPLVGESFGLSADALQLAVTLIEATALPARPDADRPPFSLLFEGPADPPLAQATYGLSHPALGPAPQHVFLVPVARGPAGMHYEAVFN